MTTPTLKQWQRRALKAEAELQFIQQCRQIETAQQMKDWKELALCKVALNEIQDALELVGGCGMSDVAVLFARADSIYKTFPECDVYDIERDARTWPGGCPVVAHPPCRAWGRLSHMANPRPDEKDLARWAVKQVREWGGVLEHPNASRLWADQGLALPGEGKDEFGGWTLPIFQQWFGHRAEKSTLLYIVGCEPGDLPPIPYIMGTATHTIASSKSRQHRDHPQFRPEVSKAEREHTPPEMARWLVELAKRCRVNQLALETQ